MVGADRMGALHEYLVPNGEGLKVPHENPLGTTELYALR